MGSSRTRSVDRWDQGFATHQNRCVRFVHKATAELIAERARKATGERMDVWPEDDMWCYGPSRQEGRKS